jgi:hypothetical protein
MLPKDNLTTRQNEAENAYRNMLDRLMDFQPCQSMSIADVKAIAEMARTIAFNAVTNAQ